MSQQPLLYLSDQDVRRLADPGAYIEMAEAVLKMEAEGRITYADPGEMQLRAREHKSRYKVKGCVLEAWGVGGFRASCLGRDFGHGTGGPARLVLLHNAATGRYLAVLDEAWSSALRTGAGTAVAARRLVVPGPITLTLLGVGPIGQATLIALHAALPLKEVRILSRRPETRQSFAREMAAQLGVPVAPWDDLRAAVKGAQLVIGATTAQEPLIKTDWIEPGMTVFSMAEGQEVEPSAYKAVDKFIADRWEQILYRLDIKALVAQGKLSQADLYAEWVDLVGGRKAGRENPQERILVRTQGLVTQDIGCAWWLYNEAVRRGVGTPLPL